MNIAQKILLAAIAAEAALLGGMRWPKSQRPLPEASKAALDPETAAEIGRLEQSLPRNDAPSWAGLGEVYRAFNLLADAERCFGEANRRAPANATYIFDRAVTLSRMGETQKAAELFERAIASDIPQAGEARLMRARDRLREENPARAEELLREIKDSPDATVLRARLLIRNGRAAEAAAILDAWLQAAPDDFRARQMRTWAAEALGKPDEARAHHQLALRSRAWMHRMDSTNGRDEQVRQQFPRAQILANVQSHEAQSKWHEAAAGLRQALAMSWSDEDSARLASAELNGGRATEAIQELERLIGASGASGEHLLSLARAWLAAGDKQKAWECAVRAEQLGANQSPTGNLQVQHLLASLAAERNDATGARRYQAGAQFELGKIAWLENNVAQARQHFLRATALSPEFAHAWFYLAECTAAMGDLQAARQTYERCLELNPNHGRAVAALKRL